MLKKTCLIFVFLTLQTTFYGFNADFSTSSEAGITLEEKMEARYVISPYDHVIRNISEREGNDWRLMSAIAYHESRFKADIVSRRGARGLMPNSWEVVLRYLELKSDPAYYQHEVVKCGKFTGYRQTRAFVQDVMNRYNKYCRIAQL